MSSSFHRPIHTEPCPLSRGRRTLRRVRAVHLSDGGCHVAIIKHEQLIFRNMRHGFGDMSSFYELIYGRLLIKSSFVGVYFGALPWDEF